MMIVQATRRYRWLYSGVALAFAFMLTACHSSDRERADQMTSFSANGL